MRPAAFALSVSRPSDSSLERVVVRFWLIEYKYDRSCYLSTSTMTYRAVHQLHRNMRAKRGVRATSGVDAVDGSSTGTRVPWMWGLLRLPRFRGASHADDNNNRFRHRQVGFPGSRRLTLAAR